MFIHKDSSINAANIWKLELNLFEILLKNAFIEINLRYSIKKNLLKYRYANEDFFFISPILLTLASLNFRISEVSLMTVIFDVK